MGLLALQNKRLCIGINLVAILLAALCVYFVSQVFTAPYALATQDEEEAQATPPPPAIEQMNADDKAEEKELKPDPVAIMPPKDQVPLSLIQLGKGESFSRYAFVADKSTRTLSVWENVNGLPRFLEAHPMDIGKKAGNKTAENDHRTPEGVYYPQQILEGKELDYSNYGVRAFTLDYPNFFDRREKKTGYGIWLHAIPPTKSLSRGSRGCVVVRNEIITKLSQYMDLKKTPFIIDDKVEYADPAEFKKKKEQMLVWLKKWEEAWETKDIDNYIANYGDDFRALRMDKPTWKRFKEGLNKKYENISVSIYNPTVLSKDDMYVVSFLQEYDSDKKKDFGIKTLFIKERDSKLEIIGEQWRPTNSEVLALKEKLDIQTSANLKN